MSRLITSYNLPPHHEVFGKIVRTSAVHLAGDIMIPRADFTVNRDGSVKTARKSSKGTLHTAVIQYFWDEDDAFHDYTRDKFRNLRNNQNFETGFNSVDGPSNDVLKNRLRLLWNRKGHCINVTSRAEEESKVYLIVSEDRDHLLRIPESTIDRLLR